MTPIPRFEATATSDEVAVALREQGVAIVERLASPELCDAVEAELEPHIAATPPGGDEFTGSPTPAAPVRCWPGHRAAST